MYQSSLSPVLSSDSVNSNRAFHSNLQMNSLIEERKIIRIVKPQLQSEIESRMSNGRYQSNIIHHRGQLFLSLQKITNLEKREALFSLLRRYQIDENINIDLLPNFIREILGEPTQGSNHFVSSLTISTFLGGVSGILALALAVIGLMIAGVPTVSEMGMRLTALAFAAGCVLGCIFCTLALWTRLRQPTESDLGTSQSLS